MNLIHTLLFFGIGISSISQNGVRCQCFHDFEITFLDDDRVRMTIRTVFSRWLNKFTDLTLMSRNGKRQKSAFDTNAFTSLVKYSQRPSILNLYSCLPSGKSTIATKSLSLHKRNYLNKISMIDDSTGIYLFTMRIFSFQFVNEPTRKASLSLGEAGYLKTTGIFRFSFDISGGPNCGVLNVDIGR